MTFENVHNYYEKLVAQALREALRRRAIELDDSALEDAGCVALNQLPPRYVRHDVDLIFYLTPEERREMESRVEEAVERAIELVRNHKRGD